MQQCFSTSSTLTSWIQVYKQLLIYCYDVHHNSNAIFFVVVLYQGHNVSTHCNVLKMMANELSDIGSEVSLVVLFDRMLMTLSPGFDTFQVILNTVPPNDQTVLNLIAKLVIEEQRLKRRNSGVETAADTAFFADHQSRAAAIKKHEDNDFAARSGYQGENQKQKLFFLVVVCKAIILIYP